MFGTLQIETSKLVAAEFETGPPVYEVGIFMAAFGAICSMCKLYHESYHIISYSIHIISISLLCSMRAWLLAARHASLRKRKVENLTLRPNKRGRHEKFSLKELIKKEESAYVDFQQAPCKSMFFGDANVSRGRSRKAICHFDSFATCDSLDIAIVRSQYLRVSFFVLTVQVMSHSHSCRVVDVYAIGEV